MSQSLLFKRRIRKLIAVAASVVVMSSIALTGLPGTAGASVGRYKFTAYSYSAVNYYLGRTATVTVNPCDGTLSGYGTANPGVLENSTITGFLTSATTAEFVTYPVSGSPGCMVTAFVTLNPADGSFSGTWSDNYLPGARSGAVIAGPPTSITSTSFVNHGQYVPADGPRQ